jgi:hypothetical protein
VARTLKPESLTVGLGLIVLGLLWILANLGRLDLLSTLRTWWPAILIVWGVLELYETFEARSALEKAPGGLDPEAEAEGESSGRTP